MENFVLTNGSQLAVWFCPIGYKWTWTFRHISGPPCIGITDSLVLGINVVIWKHGFIAIRVIIVNETNRMFKGYNRKSYEDAVHVRSSEYLHGFWSLL